MWHGKPPALTGDTGARRGKPPALTAGHQVAPRSHGRGIVKPLEAPAALQLRHRASTGGVAEKAPRLYGRGTG